MTILRCHQCRHETKISDGSCIIRTDWLCMGCRLRKLWKWLKRPICKRGVYLGFALLAYALWKIGG